MGHGTPDFCVPEKDSQSTVAGPPSCASVALKRRLDERWVVATQSLHTLGERYSIVVHVRGALLSRCTR